MSRCVCGNTGGLFRQSQASNSQIVGYHTRLLLPLSQLSLESHREYIYIYTQMHSNQLLQQVISSTDITETITFRSFAGRQLDRNRQVMTRENKHAAGSFSAAKVWYVLILAIDSIRLNQINSFRWFQASGFAFASVLFGDVNPALLPRRFSVASGAYRSQWFLTVSQVAMMVG